MSNFSNTRNSECCDDGDRLARFYRQCCDNVFDDIVVAVTAIEILSESRTIEILLRHTGEIQELFILLDYYLHYKVMNNRELLE